MARTGPVGVGIIGAGMISDTYLQHLKSFPDLVIHSVGDLEEARAHHQADKWNVAEAGLPQTVLENPEVEIVVNLTIPAAHVDVSSRALSAGKHVWSEKPLGVDREEVRGLLDLARKMGRRIGVAPDTILGPGAQTALRAIRDGAIGTPVSASTVMQFVGPDIMHPNPEFLFLPGAGPLFDMGPYYLSTLVYALGPIMEVVAVGSTPRVERRVRVGERAGTVFPVGVATSVSVLMNFASGVISQSTLSFDSPITRYGVVEISGTEGTIVLPDPNSFGEEVRLFRAPSSFPWPKPQPFEVIEPIYAEASGRGIGVLDMARSIRSQRPHVASAELGSHVLDAMAAIKESLEEKRFVPIESSAPVVPLLPEDFDPYSATL